MGVGRVRVGEGRCVGGSREVCGWEWGGVRVGVEVGRCEDGGAIRGGYEG